MGRDIIDTARYVEGVIAVRDRLTYPANQPYSPGPCCEQHGSTCLAAAVGEARPAKVLEFATERP